MSLIRPREDFAIAEAEVSDVNDAETLFVLWETSPETVEQLLPAPLHPARRPLALAMLGTHPRMSFGPIYREAALGLRAEMRGLEGFYFLAVPVTDSAALVYGRESLGYLKKLGDIFFNREGRTVGGWVQRHGVRYFAVQAQLGARADTLDAEIALDDLFDSTPGSVVMISYSFKNFPAPNLDGFDYPPRLVREEVEYWPRTIERGRATVSLRSSEYDQWSRVEVVRMLGAVYIKGPNSMRNGQVVTEPDPGAFSSSYGQVPVDLR